MKKLFTIFAMLIACLALNAQNARIVLEANDVWGDGTGYQILLDAEATEVDALTGNLECGASYDAWEYLIPANATAADENVIVAGTGEVMIPAGTYDYVVVNPGCAAYGTVYVASDQCDQSRGDNYTFEANKTYHFVATMNGQNDCITLTVTDGTTGVEENEVAFSIYPNPATDVLTVNAENINNVEVLNILGQVVNTTNESNVNVSNLTNGVYFVRVNFLDGTTATQKFIKK